MFKRPTIRFYVQATNDPVLCSSDRRSGSMFKRPTIRFYASMFKRPTICFYALVIDGPVLGPTCCGLFHCNVDFCPLQDIYVSFTSAPMDSFFFATILELVVSLGVVLFLSRQAILVSIWIHSKREASYNGQEKAQAKGT